MIIESLNIKGYQVDIELDECAYSPRENDTITTMACWHRRYDLGDVQPKTEPLDYMLSLIKEFDANIYDRLDRLEQKPGFDKASFILKEFDKHYFALDLYLMDHSGLSMNTGGFRDCDPHGWDWGQVGFIFMSKEKARKEIGRLTKANVKKVYDWLESDVETYSAYLEGEVYGYTVLRVVDGDEEDVDSCSGFYGEDGRKHMMEGYILPAIEHDIKARRTSHFENVKTWIRNRVPFEYRTPNLAVV